MSSANSHLGDLGFPTPPSPSMTTLCLTTNSSAPCPCASVLCLCVWCGSTRLTPDVPLPMANPSLAVQPTFWLRPEVGRDLSSPLPPPPSPVQLSDVQFDSAGKGVVHSKRTSKLVNSAALIRGTRSPPCNLRSARLHPSGAALRPGGSRTARCRSTCGASPSRACFRGE